VARRCFCVPHLGYDNHLARIVEAGASRERK